MGTLPRAGTFSFLLTSALAYGSRAAASFTPTRIAYDALEGAGPLAASTAASLHAALERDGII